MLATGLFGSLIFLTASPNPIDAAEPSRVVIPFDFESKFDEGRYGQIVGDLLWTKLKKQGGFIVPETMQDVRDWCQRTKTQPNAETPLNAMKDIVVKEQAGDLAIWGKIERVPGTDVDEYDFTIKVADFSTTPVKILYEKQARTKTVSEIPHVYVKEALDALYGRVPTAPVPPDPRLDQRWASAPNLVRGDFEAGQGSPIGWDALTPNITRIVEKDEGSKGIKRKPNHVIRFSFNEEVAGNAGVLYYSHFFPVEANAVYRFQCKWRTSGSAVKVFVKCYDELPTPDLVRVEGNGPDVSASQKREVYRSQQNLQGPKDTWNIHTEDFTPKSPQFTPRWGRVMLYAYWPAGTVDWDDVVVKQVAPPPTPTPSSKKKAASKPKRQ